MDYAIKGTLTPTEEYFVEANQEDFAIQMLDVVLEDDVDYIINNCPTIAALPQEQWPFTISATKRIEKSCYDGLLERRMDLITDRYENIEIDVRESKDIYFSTDNQSYRFRVLKDMDEINQSFFVEGRAPINDNEVAIAEIFAKNNGYFIGETITISDTNYTVSGYVLFPDYSLTILDESLIIDNSSQTLALMTDAAFDQLEQLVHVEIAGVFTDGYSDTEFETDVIDDYRNHDDLSFVTNIVLTINNMRSGAIYSELAGAQGMSIVLSLLIASIALMIVAIMVSRILHSQRGPIGVLKSMGYTNAQIAAPYIFFISIMSLPIIILGYFIGYLMATPFMNIYLDFYLLPSQVIEQTMSTIIVAIVVPFVFIVGLSYLIIVRMLRQKPVTLLNPEVTSDTNKLVTWIAKFFKRLKITSKLQQLLLYRNLVKFIVFLTGMFYAAFLILFSFSMNGLFDRMIYDYYNDTNHEYIGYCDYIGVCEIPADGEKVIEISTVVNDENAIVIGLENDNQLHPLYNNKHEDITSELTSNNAVITQSIALIRGYSIGDRLDIIVGDESVPFTVVDITEEYTGNKLYVNRNTLSNALMDDGEYYNAVYSESTLLKDDYLAVITIEDIIQQADSMAGFMNAFVYVMVIVSIVIGAIIIYILTVMTIEDNFYNISLFKVIGYNHREINNITLGGYLMYGVGIFIVTIPISILTFTILEMFFAQFYDLLFPLQFVWWHGIVSVIIYVIIFYIGAWSAKRKLSQISLQEAMKMYQV
jgi:putative ABC transport system permease protein